MKQKNIETMNFDKLPTWLTTQEVCEYLRISMPTLLRLIQKKTITAVKFGGHYRIHKDLLPK